MFPRFAAKQALAFSEKLIVFRISLELATLISLVLLVSHSQPAFAVVVPIGSIEHLHQSLSHDIPEPVRKQIETALKSEESNYVSGSWTNAIILLRFSGDTAAINELLKQLAKCPAITLSVSFKTLNANCDWMIVNDTRHSAEKLSVIVNLDSPRIRLEELVIPPSKGSEPNPEP